MHSKFNLLPLCYQIERNMKTELKSEVLKNFPNHDWAGAIAELEDWSAKDLKQLMFDTNQKSGGKQYNYWICRRLVEYAFGVIGKENFDSDKLIDKTALYIN